MEAVLILRSLILFVFASVLASSVAVGLSVPAAEVPAPAAPIFHQFRSIGEMIAAHPVSHQAPSMEPFADPVTHARVMLEDELVLGATPVSWVASGRADSWLALESTVEKRDLVAETVRLNLLVGSPVSVADVAAMQAQAKALPVEVRDAFAGLVGVVADVYEVQLPIAASVLSHTKATFENDAVVSMADRDTMAASARDIVAAQNAFSAAAATFPVLATSGAPLFSDPEGLVVLGGLDADTYTRSGSFPDPVLLVDLGGDDAYLNSAGGACPDPLHTAHRCNGLAVSVVLDLAGADSYFYDGLPAVIQGSGSFGGLGILTDLSGDDSYSSTMRRTNSGPTGLAVMGYVDGGGQGFGQAGYGLLLDAAGNDIYRLDVESIQGRSIWDFGQGFGSLGGIGVIADGSGDDMWLSHGLGIPKASGFQGVYVGGVGFFGGLGILSETGAGNDIYRSYNNGTTTDYYALGFAAFGGVGIFYEDGGDDDYTAVEVATDPFIVPLLNCAFGTASFGGVGIFLEMSGNDRYFGDTVSPYAASTFNEGYGGPGAAYGLFVDVRGDDLHFMEAHGGTSAQSYTAGRGVLLKGGGGGLTNAGMNIAATYLDLGGNDQYTGATPSADGSTWAAGADINLPMPFLGVR